GNFEGNALVGELIHPDAIRDRRRSSHRSALGSGSSRGGSLSAELPPGVHEALQRPFVVEDEDHTEFLHAHTESGLELDHLHESLTLGLIVDSKTFSGAGAGDENLYAQIAED